MNTNLVHLENLSNYIGLALAKHNSEIILLITAVKLISYITNNCSEITIWRKILTVENFDESGLGKF